VGVRVIVDVNVGVPVGVFVIVAVEVGVSVLVEVRVKVIVGVEVDVWVGSLNTAVTALLSSIVNTQESVPEQPPLQPKNSHPEFAVAVKVRSCPATKDVEQVPEVQLLIPMGLELTVPPPSTVTDRV
jgi:hypothetical protein